MFYRMLVVMITALPSSALLAGEINGTVTDEQGTGLPGVRICLSEPDTAPEDCRKTRFTDKKGGYSFKGMDAGDTYTLKVLADASLNGRKANPFPEYAWGPIVQEIQLATKKDKMNGIDFTGSFSFSNFQAELRLSGSDFPELANYDLRYDYVFLKVYTVDVGSAEQNLIFLGQVSYNSELLIEASVPLSTTRLVYELYSAAAPEPFIGSISLS